MKLKDDINEHLKQLRRCETQATAVAWMTRAYKLLEACLSEIDEKPPAVIERLVRVQVPFAVEKLVFVPERPKLEVVQSVTAFDVRAAEQRRRQLQEKSHAQTVVYPDVFLPPGLKPLPKPWTREDTRRLERATKSSRPPIQKRGR